MAQQQASNGDTVQKIGISTKLSATVARSPDIQIKVIDNQDFIAQLEFDEINIELEQEPLDEETEYHLASDTSHILDGALFDNDLIFSPTSEETLTNQESDNKGLNLQEDLDDKASSNSMLNNTPNHLEYRTDGEAQTASIDEQAHNVDLEYTQRVVGEQTPGALTPFEAITSTPISSIYEDGIGWTLHSFTFDNGYRIDFSSILGTPNSDSVIFTPDDATYGYIDGLFPVLPATVGDYLDLTTAT